LKAVKINDTSYLSWGSSPKLVSGLLWLIRVETRPAAVCPPLLLSLQLQLLHVVDSLASVTLSCLGSIDVLVQHLLYVVALHPQLTLLLGDGTETSGRRRPSDEVRGSTGARTGGPATWCLPCPLLIAGTVP